MSADRPLTSGAGVRAHPTAVIHPGANVSAGVDVGPYAVIDRGVTIGAGTVVGAHCVIKDGVTIGRENVLSVGVVLGEVPQHRKFSGERSFVRIGDRNIFREYVTINRAYGEGETTEIGSDNYLMSHAHVGHNCRVGDGVIMTSSAALAGHVLVSDRANLSGYVGVHQFVRIGRLVMVGGGSIVRQDIPPFVLATGNPARAYGLNTVGLTRLGVPAVHRTMLKRAFMILYRSQLAVSSAIRRMEAELGDDPYVREFIDFVQGGEKRGIIRWSRETS